MNKNLCNSKKMINFAARNIRLIFNTTNTIMKCPYCGYDKIQPNFNFCPKCKRPLNEQAKEKRFDAQEEQKPQEKGFLNRAISRWTYERAAADPRAYAAWAVRNPNDNRVFLGQWNAAGQDLVTIRQAISEASAGRQDGPDRNHPEVNRAFVDTVNQSYTTDAAAVVRNKAIWKLQAGELARHIAPDEWVYISEHLEGLVIEEGTSAIIYVDGQEVEEMGSGMYLFDDKRAEAEAEASRNTGVPAPRGLFGRMADSIYRFLTGRRRDDSTRMREERRQRVERIMGRLRKDTMIDIYLKSDRIFPAIFGQQHLSDTPDGYQPYVIQSRYLDVQVGVSMQMQIGNFKEFITNYMPGKKSVSIADVVKSADSAVLSILRFRLRDIEVSERGLDEATYNAIKEHLKQNVPNLLHGVIIVDILDIATTNEQLARFRKVEEQLYCSEREYDFLIRTNEFRNRIASEENDQKIREARSAEELRVRLDEINKDKLIHDDEMEQFVSLLQNERKIREANNQADLDKALQEIKRNSLISQEEFDIFNNDLENRRFDREQVSEQLRARSLMATALQKLEIDKTLQVANIRNVEEVSEAEWESFRKQKGREAEGWDLEAAIYGRRYLLEKQQLVDEVEKNKLKIDSTRVADEYEIERIKRQHELEEQLKEDELKRSIHEKEEELRLEKERRDMEMSATEREAHLAMENMRAMNEHEREMERIKTDLEKAKVDAERNMTADQLLGRNITGMDAAAQAAFAESFAHKNDVELTKANAEQQAELYRQMVQMAQESGANAQKVQKEMVDSMVGMMRDVATAKISDAQNMKEEYRTQMQHEQERMDSTQKQSLDYTSRVNMAESLARTKGNLSVNVHVGEPRICPNCGQRIEDKEAACCPVCGTDLK